MDGQMHLFVWVCLSLCACVYVCVHVYVYNIYIYMYMYVFTQIPFLSCAAAIAFLLANRFSQNKAALYCNVDVSSLISSSRAKCRRMHALQVEVSEV